MTRENVVIVGPEEQAFRIAEEQRKCARLMAQNNSNVTDPYCSPLWDNISCWPATPAGITHSIQCPMYINGFKIDGKAFRECMPDGRWFIHPKLNKTFANYTNCMSTTRPTIAPVLHEHMSSIRLMYNIGYGISLVSLLIAVGIMLYFKKLHCPRNTVHINLFLSFILRSSITILKDNLFVEGLGLASDVQFVGHKPIFKANGTHWECKLLITLFNYAVGASHAWICLEGVYLHIIIFISVFTDRKCSAVWYVVLGWSFPLSFVLPWAIVRGLLEDVLCWNTHPTKSLFWIIRGPITCTIVINFIFFLNIVRILFTKLRRTSHPEAKKYRYLKMARSVAVLIPLFGVHYIVFVGLPHEADPHTEVVIFYWEMFFNSFQGFLVALLFCFFNHEVQVELRRRWHRYNVRRLHSRRSSRTASTVLAYSIRHRPCNNNQSHSSHSQADSASPKDSTLTVPMCTIEDPAGQSINGPHVRVWRSKISNNNVTRVVDIDKHMINMHAKKSGTAECMV